jgi:hypothetical protein
LRGAPISGLPEIGNCNAQIGQARFAGATKHLSQANIHGGRLLRFARNDKARVD